MGFAHGEPADSFLSARDSPVVLRDSTFLDSPAVDGAGFLLAKRAPVLSIDGCLFQQGFGPEGGAVSVAASGSVAVSRSVFLQNTARIAPTRFPYVYAPSGGAMLVDVADSLSVDGCLFLQNAVRVANSTAPRVYAATGGAIQAISVSALSLSASLFADNAVSAAASSGSPVSASGGAVFAEDCATVTLSGVAFRNNSAAALSFDGTLLAHAQAAGGALVLLSMRKLSMLGLLFAGNTATALDAANATAAGGGFFTDDARNAIFLTNCSFLANAVVAGRPSLPGASAVAAGAAVFAIQAPLSLRVQDCLFADQWGSAYGNVSIVVGGVLLAPIDGSVTTFADTAFLRNDRFNVTSLHPVRADGKNHLLVDNTDPDLVEGLLVFSSAIGLTRCTVAQHHLVLPFFGYGAFRGFFLPLLSATVQSSSFSDLSLAAFSVYGGVFSLPAGSTTYFRIFDSSFTNISFSVGYAFRGGALDAFAAQIQLADCTFSDFSFLFLTLNANDTHLVGAGMGGLVLSQITGSLSASDLAIRRVTLQDPNPDHNFAFFGGVMISWGSTAIDRVSVEGVDITIYNSRRSATKSPGVFGLILYATNFTQFTLSNSRFADITGTGVNSSNIMYYGVLCLGGATSGPALMVNSTIANVRYSQGCSCHGCLVVTNDASFAVSDPLLPTPIPSFSLVNSTFEDNIMHCFEPKLVTQGMMALELQHQLLIDGCTFRRNSLNYFLPLPGHNNQILDTGGAMFITFTQPDFSATIHNSRYVENMAGDGGAIYLNVINRGTVHLSSCHFQNNFAWSGLGGAIYASFSYNALQNNLAMQLIIEDTSFIGNNAFWIGGALTTLYTNTSLHNCSFIGNTIGHNPANLFNVPNFMSGGAISQTLGTLNVDNCTFSENISPTSGGAIWITGPDSFSISNSLFYRNEGVIGGGIWFQVTTCIPDTMFIINTSFIENYSQLGGAALSVNGLNTAAYPTVMFDGCTFQQNSGVGLFGLVSVQNAVPWSYSRCTVNPNTNIAFISANYTNMTILSPPSAYVIIHFFLLIYFFIYFLILFIYVMSKKSEIRNSIIENNFEWFIGFNIFIRNPNGTMVSPSQGFVVTAGEMFEIVLVGNGQCGSSIPALMPDLDEVESAFVLAQLNPTKLDNCLVSFNSLNTNVSVTGNKTVIPLIGFQASYAMNGFATINSSGQWSVYGLNKAFSTSLVHELLGLPPATDGRMPSNESFPITVLPLPPDPDFSYIIGSLGNALSLDIPCSQQTGFVVVQLYDKYQSPPSFGTSFLLQFTSPILPTITSDVYVDTPDGNIVPTATGRAIAVPYLASQGGEYVLNVYFNNSVRLTGPSGGTFQTTIHQPSATFSEVICDRESVVNNPLFCKIFYRNELNQSMPSCNQSIACTTVSLKKSLNGAQISPLTCSSNYQALFFITSPTTGNLDLSVTWAGQKLAISPSTPKIVPLNPAGWWSKHWIYVMVGSLILLILIFSTTIFVIYRRYQRLKQEQGAEYRLLTTSSFVLSEDGRLQLTLDEILADPSITKIPWHEISTSEADEAILGTGSSGSVFSGNWGEIPVAIKRLHMAAFRNCDDADFDDFKREIKILSELHHPHVLTFYGISLVSTTGVDVALITELMERGSLDTLLAAGALIDVPFVYRLQIALDIAAGCAYLHDACNPPIIHRDLKPANILINAQGVAKVCDFGVSTFRSNMRRNMTQAIGTPVYAAPEVLESNKYTETCDQYSYGTILCELFSGKRVYSEADFSGMEMVTILYQVCHQGLRPKVVDDLPLLVKNIIHECLDADPELRPRFREILDRLVRLKRVLSFQK